MVEGGFSLVRFGPGVTGWAGAWAKLRPLVHLLLWLDWQP